MASDLQSLGALGPILPEIVLALAALVLLLVGVVFLKREHSVVLTSVAIAVLALLAAYVGFNGAAPPCCSTAASSMTALPAS